jgi:uncharacterized SAM-binding protein YcdF (DUF218 family)
MGSIVGFVISYRGLIVALLAAALWIRFRPTSRAARRVAIAVLAAYSLASIYLIPYTLSRALVAGYEPLSAAGLPAGPAVIVVLSGGSGYVDGWDGRRWRHMVSVTASRTWEAHRVHRLKPDAWVIATDSAGDDGEIREQSTPVIHDALVQLGIPSTRVVILREAADTHDEAVRIAPLVRSLEVDHVVLVTSDIHMRRSRGTFRAQGLDVIPAIARDPWASREWSDWVIPSEHGLALSARLVHEILGLAYYSARGWME